MGILALPMDAMPFFFRSSHLESNCDGYYRYVRIAEYDENNPLNHVSSRDAIEPVFRYSWIVQENDEWKMDVVYEYSMIQSRVSAGEK